MDGLRVVPVAPSPNRIGSISSVSEALAGMTARLLRMSSYIVRLAPAGQ
jgi:hypothetical protein